MEITWYGHSCFRISERAQTTVVCDPFDSHQVGYEPLKLKADIVTISHDAPSHNFLKAVKGSPYVITGPGEYEVGGVFITGVSTNGHSKKNTDITPNALYLIEYNGINLVHLGDMDQVPTQSQVEELGPVQVALVPVGGGSSLSANKAAEVISLLEPNIVIPMHYATAASTIPLEPISKFLKEMGLSEVETLTSLKINAGEALPEETRVVVLEYAHSV